LFKPFAISPPEPKHGNGDHRKEDKDIGFLLGYAPKGNDLIDGYYGHGQVEVFGIT
jgi:hypothetical protein